MSDRPSMEWPYWMAYVGFGSIFRTFFRLRVIHPERVPLQGPCILAANHASFIDPPLIGCSVPRQLSMLARSSLFRFPVFGAVLRSWRAVPVDPKGGSAAGLKAIMDRLNQGGAVLIFPEGTRSWDGQLLPVRSGVGLAVIKSGAPVVPVRVWGTHEAYGRDHRVLKPHKLTVKVGRILDLDSLRREAESCDKQRLKGIYQDAAQEVMKGIAALEPTREVQTFP